MPLKHLLARKENMLDKVRRQSCKRACCDWAWGSVVVSGVSEFEGKARRRCWRRGAPVAAPCSDTARFRSPPPSLRGSSNIFTSSSRRSRRRRHSHSAFYSPLVLLMGCWLLRSLELSEAAEEGAKPESAKPPGPTLYIAGTFGKFTTDDGTVHNVTGIAEWKDNTIKPIGMGVGLPQEAQALDYHPQPRDCTRKCKNSRTCWTTCTTGTTAALYVGGTFTLANGEEVYRITAARNGSMLEIDKGVSNTVTVIAVHQPSGIVYLGGMFTDATGVAVRYVASWDGINWDQMGGGVGNPPVCSAGREKKESEEAVVFALALMGGTDKAAPKEGTSVPPSQYGTEKYRPKVFVGGRFRRAGQGADQVVAHHIAMWDPAAADGKGQWSALCDPRRPARCTQGGIGEGEDASGNIGALEYVLALALHEASQRLFVGGIFQSAGQVFASINSLAVYDLKTMLWKRVGNGISGPNALVHVLVFPPHDPDKLYVAGSFQEVDKQNEDLFFPGIVSYSIARFSIATGQWEGMGGGIPDATIRTLAVTKDKLVYAGGDIDSVGGQDAGGIAVFDGTSWKPLGKGARNEDGSSARVYKIISVEFDIGKVTSSRQLMSGAMKTRALPALLVSLHVLLHVFVTVLVSLHTH